MVTRIMKYLKQFHNLYYRTNNYDNNIFITTRLRWGIVIWHQAFLRNAIGELRFTLRDIDYNATTKIK